MRASQSPTNTSAEVDIHESIGVPARGPASPRWTGCVGTVRGVG